MSVFIGLGVQLALLVAIAQRWDEMSDPTRLTILATATVFFLGMGFVTSLSDEPAFPSADERAWLLGMGATAGTLAFLFTQMIDVSDETALFATQTTDFRMEASLPCDRMIGTMERWGYLSRFAGVVLLTVLACSSGEGLLDSFDQLETVRNARQSTMSARTSRVSFSVVVASGSVTVQENEGSGVWNFAESSGRFTTKLAQPADYHGSTETVVVGGYRYFKVPPEDLEKGLARRPWVRSAVPTGEGYSGAELVFGLSLESVATLASALDVLDGAAQVRGLGAGRHRGSRVARFDVEVDGSEQELLEGMQQESRVEVWIDERGRVRKLILELTSGEEIAQAQQLGEVRINLTLEFFDFGVSVEVTPPPASDVDG